MQFLQDPMWYNIFSLSVVIVVAIVALATIVIINKLRHKYYISPNTQYIPIAKNVYKTKEKGAISIPIVDSIPLLSEEAESKGEIDFFLDDIPLHKATIVTLSINLRALDLYKLTKGSSLHFFGGTKLLKVDILDTDFSWYYTSGRDSDDHYDWRRDRLAPEGGLKAYGQMIRLGGALIESLIRSGMTEVILNVLLEGSVNSVEMHYDEKPYWFKEGER